MSPACWNILVSRQYFTRISSVHPHSPTISLFNWISSTSSLPLNPHDGTHTHTHLTTRRQFYIPVSRRRKRSDVNEIPVSSSSSPFSTESPLMSFRWPPTHLALVSRLLSVCSGNCVQNEDAPYPVRLPGEMNEMSNILCVINYISLIVQHGNKLTMSPTSSPETVRNKGWNT